MLLNFRCLLSIKNFLVLDGKALLVATCLEIDTLEIRLFFTIISSLWNRFSQWSSSGLFTIRLIDCIIIISQRVTELLSAFLVFSYRLSISLCLDFGSCSHLFFLECMKSLCIFIELIQLIFLMKLLIFLEKNVRIMANLLDFSFFLIPFQYCHFDSLSKSFLVTWVLAW